jgi:hypothetical protein
MADPTKDKRIAMGDVVVQRAEELAPQVRYLGQGVFTVPSSSGGVYEVTTPRYDRDPRRWVCSCAWALHQGLLCAHVRAVESWLGSYLAERDSTRNDPRDVLLARYRRHLEATIAVMSRHLKVSAEAMPGHLALDIECAIADARALLEESSS